MTTFVHSLSDRQITITKNRKEGIDTMKATFGKYKITAKYIGDKESNWDQTNYNNHKVTVKNIETGKRLSFDFWASIMRPEIQTEKEVLEAFQCFLEDITYSEYSFDEFCREMGYSDDSIKAHNVYKTILKEAKKASSVITDDIHTLLEQLNKKLYP